MNGYAAAVRQFYDIYRPIARRYGLRMSSHTSIYDDGWIKIYKGEGADRQQIIKIEEANDTDLYDRATQTHRQRSAGQQQTEQAGRSFHGAEET